MTILTHKKKKVTFGEYWWNWRVDAVYYGGMG